MNRTDGFPPPPSLSSYLSLFSIQNGSQLSS